MAIYIDKENNQTICICDICGAASSTESPNGVVTEGWGTGQLWIDISLTEEKQVPLTFCPTCTEPVKQSTNYSLVIPSVEE